MWKDCAVILLVNLGRYRQKRVTATIVLRNGLSFCNKTDSNEGTSVI
jgi:hypothetical protein